MVKAHAGLPVRDFRAVAPPPDGGPAVERADFYASLSAEFEREMAETAPIEDEARPLEAAEISESF